MTLIFNKEKIPLNFQEFQLFPENITKNDYFEHAFNHCHPLKLENLSEVIKENQGFYGLGIPY